MLNVGASQLPTSEQNRTNFELDGGPRGACNKVGGFFFARFVTGTGHVWVWGGSLWAALSVLPHDQVVIAFENGRGLFFSLDPVSVFVF